MTKKASFDVFDTVLTRRVATPASLFLLIGRRALKSGLVRVDASTFQEQRIASEKEARALSGCGEVGIEEIYRVLIARLGVCSQDANALLRLELDLEAKAIVAIPSAFEMIAAARRWSPTVLFASDMYLPADFIRDQLVMNGLWRLGDKLYVSGEFGVSKAAGELYKRVLRDERLRPASMVHTGDRRDADVDVPSQLGLKTRHKEVCTLGRYEQLMEGFAKESGGFASVVAGTSRLTRLGAMYRSKHLLTLSVISSSLIGPIVALYALWILRQVKERDLERLYFVARDGYLIKKAVDALARVFGLALDTRYLYGSRQAWHLPAISDVSNDPLSWLFERTRTLTPRIVLGRLQITTKEMEEVLRGVQWSERMWDMPLDEGSLRQLRLDLLRSDGFRAVIERHALERREITLEYFEQEGLCDAKRWAVVDLGWHGRLQYSLEALLRMNGPKKTLGLYFALFYDSAALGRLETASLLDWDLRNPPEAKEIPSLVFLMESFCTAPHGSTVGYYRQRDGRIVPRFRDNGFKELRKWGLSTIHSTVDAFVGRLAEWSLPDEILEWDSRDALRNILGTFSRSPIAAEARAWGAFPYEDEQAGSVCERLTRDYELTLKNLRIAFTFGDERFLPASWNVLWHGGQAHMLSARNGILKLVLNLGKAKRRIGKLLRS